MTYFYKNKFPKVGEIVMTKVTEIHPTFAYVSLIEYDNINGIIVASEVSTKLYKAMSRFLTIGKLQAAEVLNVDETKGYVDLSKKSVKPDEMEMCEVRFKIGSQIYGIVNRLSAILDRELRDLYDNWLWKIDCEIDVIYKLFKQLGRDNPDTSVLKDRTPPEIFEQLAKICQFKFKEEPKTLRAYVEVTSLNGIEEIKDIFRILREKISANDLQIKYVSAPLYLIQMTSNDASHDIEKVNGILKEMEQVYIAREDMRFTIKQLPEISQQKEVDFNSIIKAREMKESREIEDGFEGDENSDIDE